MSMGKSIMVVGGGSAGWMTANLLHHQLQQHGFEITVIESPTIGIIGVGEGSTPQLKVFFDILGIAESTWMPACHATYKHGIRFNGWTDLENDQFNSYFHPFPSSLDHHSARPFLHQVHAMHAGQSKMPHPDEYFLTAVLAQQNKSPHLIDTAASDIKTSYGYHFDATQLGVFLKTHGTNKGIRVIQTTIEHVKQSDNMIHSVIDTQGKAYSGDWFFDCTGFNGKLIQEALGTEFIHYNDNLYNDRAVAIATNRDAIELPQTTATAMNCGWAWRIPLTHRIGNGYVYASDYLSPAQAEAELRAHLGIDESIPARHLTMKVGRLAQHWVGNTIAVGLAQGFIEPLEATALHLVQETVTQFIGAFTAGKHTSACRAQFNQNINARFEGIRDYIVAHYACNQIHQPTTAKHNTSNTYWQHCREQIALSANLQAVLACWQQGGDLHQVLVERNMQSYYPTVSWYSLLAGYRLFAHQHYQRDNTVQEVTDLLHTVSQRFVCNKRIDDPSIL